MLASKVPPVASRVARFGIIALLVAAGWHTVPAAAAQAAADKVLATVGDAKVTESQVEQTVAAQLRALDQQRHQLIEKGLEQAVDQKLLELEAAKRGTTTQDLLQKEVTSKSAAPTDAEVDAFYDAHKDQIRQPKEQLADRIRQYLAQQKNQEAYQGFIQKLRGQYQVKTYLEPLRVDVATAGEPTRGPASAPVTIVEFSDFQCPFCSRMVPVLEQVEKKYGDKVRIVYRQFPLSIHQHAQKAAEASLCAEQQGKFWQMHDAMFADQKGLSVDALKEKAAKIGLDTSKFDQCLDSGQFADEVAADERAGQAAGVNGTPALFINGRFISGAVPYEDVAKVIDDELARTSSPGGRDAGGSR